jgi:hypothetical protein
MQTCFYCYNLWLVGSLAQLVEQRTLNPLVVGSTPTRPTNEYKAVTRKSGRFFVSGLSSYLQAKF